jgi:endonuclease/exonuclease/phosphatase family metal-dependent hydrolase
MRLLNWNLQWCRGMDGVVDPERVANVARQLSDPDVCCFQEVAENFADLAGSSGEDQPARLAAAFPGYSAHFAWGVDTPDGAGGRRRFGNLILSRLPVRRVLRHSLPWPAEDQVPSMPRVAIEAVVEAAWGLVRVTTTHLEYYSGAQRAAQVERLLVLNAEAIAHSRARPAERYAAGPFQPLPRPASGILTGDFNMRPEDPLVARLREAFVDTCEGKHPPSFHVHDADEEAYCCDYVFVTPDLAPRVASVRLDAQTQASDHQPLIVEFEK